MNPKDPAIPILLVEDDEDDYIIFTEKLSEIKGVRFHLDWAPNYQAALDRVNQSSYKVCFVDYRLNEHTGLDILRAFQRQRIDTPVIILTGYGDYEIDLKAMEEGAADYLEKEHLTPSLLERSVRYAMGRCKAMKALGASQQQLRLLSTKLLEAQENERKVVARELHDSIGASLSAVKFALEQRAFEEKQESQTKKGLPLDKIISMVRSTMDEVHRISTNLRPSLLDHLGVLATVRSYCREFQEVYPNLLIHLDLDVKEEEIPENLKIILFRILQETLNNAAKYSEADEMHVCLKKTHRGLEISLKDNGKGFVPDHVLAESTDRKALGISGMRERAELFNGSFSVISGEGKGTTIEAFWPEADAT